jgi:single-stranded-DNA-specific exonuclease
VTQPHQTEAPSPAPAQPEPLSIAGGRLDWSLRQPIPTTVAELVRTERVPIVVAKLLANRGFEAGKAVAAHLQPQLTRLHDPFLLPDMRAATERLMRALNDGETILVHGDYDVDGVTGTTLLMRLFRLLGGKAVWHIPNRLTDGYSFGAHSVERARECGATVVVSVDNGTSAGDTIRDLLNAGVDTIVTDHHEAPLGALPEATAIVNPKLPSSSYPFRELCGAAVAFKLAWGMCQEVSGASRVREDLRQYLVDAMSYVAIATVCDVVPLVDENRILAHYGLRTLAQSSFPGVVSLLERCGLSGRKLTAEDVGFQIGPRINASGRLGSAAQAVELLLADDTESADRLAQVLDDLNEERRSIERELVVKAMEEAKRFADADRYPVMVIAGQGWHQGVIGIVASRLVEAFDRPALIIGLAGEEGRGSARSIPGISVLDAMHGGKDHMLRYGGHSQAAGCEVRADAVDALREAICDRARELAAESSDAKRPLVIDTELPLEQLTPTLMRQIDRLEPFGTDNETPVLTAQDVRLTEPARIIGKDRTHLLLQLRQGTQVFKALGFGMAEREPELKMGKRIDIAFTPRWNTFRGQTNLELLLRDIRSEG